MTAWPATWDDLWSQLEGELLMQPGDVAGVKVHRPAWMALARCRQVDVEVFFPRRGAPGELARATCKRCPVRSACLEYALADPDVAGIWGGTSERDRQAIRRERQLLRKRAT